MVNETNKATGRIRRVPTWLLVILAVMALVVVAVLAYVFVVLPQIRAAAMEQFFAIAPENSDAPARSGYPVRQYHHGQAQTRPCSSVRDFALEFPVGWLTGSVGCDHAEFWGITASGGAAEVAVIVVFHLDKSGDPEVALNSFLSLGRSMVGVEQPIMGLAGPTRTGVLTTVEPSGDRAIRQVIEVGAGSGGCGQTANVITVLSPDWSVEPRTKNTITLIATTCRDGADDFADDFEQIERSLRFVTSAN